MFGKFNHWWHQWSPHYLGPDEDLKYPTRTVTIVGGRFQIRQARRQDASILTAVEQQVYRSKPWNQAAFLSDLSRPRDRLYLLVTHDRQAVAYAGSSVNWFQYDMHITNIGVIPEFQSMGIGAMMLSELKSVAITNDVKSMSLEVRKSNVGAQRLCHRLGFVSTGVNPDYYTNDREDAIDMKMDLEDEGKQPWPKKP